MFEKILDELIQSLKCVNDNRKNADDSKSISFEIGLDEPVAAHDATNNDQQGSKFHITAHKFDTALYAAVPARYRGMPDLSKLMSNAYTLIVAEELKLRLFSERDEICISPWDFARILWECCYNIPNKMIEMSPVDFAMIDGSLIAGTHSVVILSNMIPILFGHSSNKGGNSNE